MTSSVFVQEKRTEVAGPLHRPVCLQLKAHQAVIAAAHMRDMFATDPARPPTGRIEGAIDRDSAVTLPIRR